MSRVSLEHCTWCKLSKTRTQVVQGAGSLDSKLLFIAESPGRFEDMSGLPFQGSMTKDIYDAILDALDLDRESVWTTYVCKCRASDETPFGRRKNRPPDVEEVEACADWLNLEIETVEPKLIITLGATALHRITGLAGMNNHRGRYISLPGKPFRIFPIYHPAFIAYHKNEQSIIDTVKDDLENLKKGIDKCLKRN